jgi:phosphatidylglycerophosphate synthase
MAKPTGVPGPGKQKARGVAGRAVEPVARGLLRLGISPDVITILGTLGVSFGALYFFPKGQLLAGVLFIMAFVFSDMIDGAMARMAQRSGKWGAFLDSSLDRVADAAIFVGLALWYLGEGDEPVLGVLALYCLAGGSLVSYVRARAESLGLQAAGGVAERTERLAVILLTTGLSGLGVPYVAAAGLWLLAIGITATVVQRMWAVRAQAQKERLDDHDAPGTP